MGTENLGYRDPGIRVYQIIANLTTPMSDVPLNPILVGACYKVVNREELVTSVKNDMQDSILFTSLDIPSLPPGGIIQPESVVLYVTGIARIIKNVSAFFNDSTSNNIVFNANQRFADFTKIFDSQRDLSKEIMSGDEIQIKHGEKSYTYTVNYVKDNYVYLYETINTTIDSNATLSITRKYANHAVALEDVSGDVDDNAVTTRDPLMADKMYPFFSCSVINISYKALRKDLSGRYKIGSLKELQDMMETSVGNPIGFFANQAINTSGAVDGVGKQLYLYITTEDSPRAVQAAVDDLSYYGVYYLVPTLGGGEVAKTYSNYVIARTQPDVGEFMMTMVSPITEVVTEEEVG